MAREGERGRDREIRVGALCSVVVACHKSGQHVNGENEDRVDSDSPIT